MAYYNRNGEKKRIAHDFRRHEEEVVRSLCRLGSRPISPRSMQEEEKRIRREIANSNERRRMQSINAGFQYLRKLLPQREGEKLSKASILQQTADFIYQLEQEKTCLLEQNSQLKRRVIDNQNNPDSDGSYSDSPFPKRKKRDLGDSVDEGIGSSPESSNEDMKKELIELRLSLEHERCIRSRLEDQIKNLELRLGIAENDYDATLQDHVSYHSSAENTGKHRIANSASDNPGINSPPHISTIKLEKFHEVPPSPELPPDEIPEDLSGKTTDSPSPHSYYYVTAEIPTSNIATVPLLHLTPHASPPAFTMELEVTSQQEPYKHARSRPNLETIVEAIRHVEGDHMFRDDSSPPMSPISSPNHYTEPQNSSQETYKLSYNQNLSLQHQIIRNAPVSQSRPGVIVSKLS